MQRLATTQRPAAGLPLRSNTVTTSPSMTAATQATSQSLPPTHPQHVWYFAYGSNMNPSVLTGRRKVTPKQSLPVFAPGHRLSFSMLGFPYVEPGFATVEPLDTTPSAPAGNSSIDKQAPTSAAASLSGTAGSLSTPPPTPAAEATAEAAAAASQQQPDDWWPLQSAPEGCAHGVIHCISSAEWRWIQSTEGVGSSQAGYQVVPIRCYTYEGRPVAAVTLQGAAASLHTSSRQAAPSERYLRLLREGAAHYGVDAAYQQRLQQLQPFTRGTWSASIGGAASAAILLGAAAPAIPLYVAGRSLGLLPSKPPSSPGGAEQQQGVPQQQAGTQAAAAAGGAAATSEPVPDLPQLAADMAEEAAAAAARGGLPAYLSWYFNAASRATWLMHDYVLQPVLGSGSSTSKLQQERR